MSDVTDRADLASLCAYDEVIDVRTPAEFALDHAPGAINLPVLTDEERAAVGTVYVQESRMKARRIGAALVARNIANHLEGALADKPGSYAPLIYCWRGGQRSLAMATVLRQVGWRPTRLAGGYMTYRRRVTAALYDGAAPRLILIDGYTGSAKTEILRRVQALGGQAIDLEGLARHRGSIFGATHGQSQPSQKLFESHLLAALTACDPARPILAEAESSKVGEINLPPALWRAMGEAPRVEISADKDARAQYLLAAYGDLAGDRAALSTLLSALPGRHGAKRLRAWLGLAEAGDLRGLAAELMEIHYDPAYERSRRKGQRRLLETIPMASLGPDDLDAAARRILALLADQA